MQMEYSTFDRGGQKIMADFNESEINWASFCAMPDQIQPVKMPSLFPVPTHIVRRRLTKTIDAAHFDKLIWSPEYVYGQGALIGKVKTLPQNSVYNSAISVNSTLGMSLAQQIVTHQPGQWNSATLVSTSFYPYDVTAPLNDSVSAGGCRLIGSVLQIEYLGKVDNIEGIVEIAMNTNTVNTKHCITPFEDINFFSEDAIQQAPYYRRFRLSDGIRTIWFPMDEARFQFNEAYQVIDSTVAAIDPAGSGTGDYFNDNSTRCFIFPTKNLDTLHAGVGTYYLPPGAHQYPNGPNDTKTPYRQDNECLHDKTRIEWAINFTGLTQECPIRIYINQYYETVPHESQMDNFFPTKGPVGNTDIATKLIQQVSGGITPTPSNNFASTVGNVLAKVFEVARGIGGFVSDNLPGLASLAGGIAGAAGGPLGSMAGSAVGNLAGTTASNLMNSVMDSGKSSLTQSTSAGGSRIFESVLIPSNSNIKPYRR